MMKKTIKHALALVLIAVFAVFALGSMGSSPSSSSGGSSSSSGCSRDNECYKESGSYPGIRCGRSSCSVNGAAGSIDWSASCNCPR